jgi:mannose-6-phosphate isomerase-like protein (cupin superfamily)
MDAHVLKRDDLPWSEIGIATFTVGGDEIHAEPGDVVIVPPNTPHAFANTGEGQLRQIDIHVSPTFSTEWL